MLQLLQYWIIAERIMPQFSRMIVLRLICVSLCLCVCVYCFVIIILLYVEKKQGQNIDENIHPAWWGWDGTDTTVVFITVLIYEVVWKYRHAHENTQLISHRARDIFPFGVAVHGNIEVSYINISEREREKRREQFSVLTGQLLSLSVSLSLADTTTSSTHLLLRMLVLGVSEPAVTYTTSKYTYNVYTTAAVV